MMALIRDFRHFSNGPRLIDPIEAVCGRFSCFLLSCCATGAAFRLHVERIFDKNSAMLGNF